MHNRLELPEELKHLIEKRIAERRESAEVDELVEPGEGDRRQGGRRSDDQLKDG